MEAKWNENKVNKCPKTALAFYIKLYCKQKGSSKTKYQSNLIEATKSWLSLSDFEKQQVYDKHKEFEYKYKLKCISQLKNADPFMRVKDPSLLHGPLDTINLNTLNPKAQNEKDRLEPELEQASQIEDEVQTTSVREELIADVESNRDPEDSQIVMEAVAADESTPKTFLEEPLPPTLKTGKDLFMLLSTEGANILWTSLPQLEKNRYNRAVSLLKKDYIIKYKEYLESLTPRELFDYYNKKIFYLIVLLEPMDIFY